MEAFLKYLAFIPAYVRDLISLLTSPKEFLRTKNNTNDLDWAKGLSFCVFSLMFIIIFDASYMPAQTNLPLYLAQTTILWFVFALFIAATIKISWLLVGGKASFESILFTHLYVYSGFTLLSEIPLTVFLGYLKSYSPGLFLEMIKSTQPDYKFDQQNFSALFQDKEVIALLLFCVSFFVLFIGWTLLIWGAYRELNRASRIRSLGAFIICGILSMPTLVVIKMLGAGSSTDIPIGSSN